MRWWTAKTFLCSSLSAATQARPCPRKRVREALGRSPKRKMYLLNFLCPSRVQNVLTILRMLDTQTTKLMVPRFRDYQAASDPHGPDLLRILAHTHGNTEKTSTSENENEIVGTCQCQRGNFVVWEPDGVLHSCFCHQIIFFCPNRSKNARSLSVLSLGSCLGLAHVCGCSLIFLARSRLPMVQPTPQ